MSEICIADCQSEFEWDGAWLDIYVQDTVVADWNRVLEALQTYEIRNEIDSEPAILPRSLTADFFRNRQACYFRAFKYGKLQINCHFFCEEQIEFDIDPREVDGQEALDNLIALLHLISDSARKDAILTPENCESIVIARVIPDSTTCEYRP